MTFRVNEGPMTMRVLQTIPILRIFDVAKAREFYEGFLGVHVDWEHRFEADAPVYLQVSRDGCVLHLTEHHGDCCPGWSGFYSDPCTRAVSSRDHS
jgi:catechol 2,3-dioxygenase-like lactoylglutathione lyase family enzyme